MIVLCSVKDREHVIEQETVLRQLEAILSIHEHSRQGRYLDALREIAKLSFLPLDPRSPGLTMDSFQNLSPYVQACVPDLLRVALSCLEYVTDTDGSLRALKTKVSLAVLFLLPSLTQFLKLIPLLHNMQISPSFIS